MAEPFIDTAALHFGLDDAESDGARGLLGRGFTMTPAYATALSGRKTLFIGRKGAGKSAICFQLSDRQGNGHCAKIVTPDQAAGTEIRQFELIGLNEPTAKSLVWRYPRFVRGF